MHYFSKFALIIVLVHCVAALTMASGVNAGADGRITFTEAAVQAETPEFWLGYKVMRRITPDDPPDAIYRDQYGMHDTIWAYELVSAYESGELSSIDLITQFWLHRPTFMVAWIENHGTLEVTTNLLLNMITSQSNGIIDVIGDDPIFFDPNRYISNEQNGISQMELDHEACRLANDILSEILIRAIFEGDPYNLIVNHCCCIKTGLAECLPKTNAGCNISPAGICEGQQGNHMCVKADGC